MSERIKTRAPIRAEEDFQMGPNYQPVAHQSGFVIQPINVTSETIMNQLFNLTGTVGGVVKQQEQFELQKGQEDFLTGKKPQETLLGKRADGYFNMKGDNDARVGYYTQINELLNKSVDYTIEEFSTEMANIENNWLEGTTKAYQDGFYSVAQSIKTSAAQKYLEQQNLKWKEDNLVQAGVNVESVLINGVNEVLMEKGYTLDTLDEEAYSRLDLEGLGVGESMRSYLSSLQSWGKNQGLTRDEMSELMIRKTGEMAVKFGMPELLDFADVKENGIALTDTKFQEVIEAYRDQANKVRTNIGDFYAKANEAEVQAKTDFLYKSYLEKSAALPTLYSNPKEMALEAQNLLISIKEDPMYMNLSATQIKDINQTLQRLSGDGSGPSFSDAFTYSDLRLRVSDGTADINTINSAFANGLLTLTDYKSLTNELVTNGEQRQAATNSSIGKLATSARKNVLQFLANPSELDLDLTKTVDYAAAELNIGDFEAAFYDTYGSNFTYDQYITEVLDPVLMEYGTSYSELRRSMKPVKPKTVNNTAIQPLSQIKDTAAFQENLESQWNDVFKDFKIAEDVDRSTTFEATEGAAALVSLFEDPEVDITNIRQSFDTLVNVWGHDPMMMGTYLNTYGYKVLNDNLNKYPTQPFVARDITEEYLRTLGYPEGILQTIVYSGFYNVYK